MSVSTTRNVGLLSAKKTLRSTMRSNLKKVPPNEIQDQSELVSSRVISHPAFQQAKTVSCYLSMPTCELDTHSIISSILQSGKKLFVPRIDRELGEMQMLEIFDEYDLNTLPSGTWGIKEPDTFKDGQPRKNAIDPTSPLLDLILLPGLAFDHKMSRLGHGKGYYDRFLTSYQASLLRRPEEHRRMPLLLGLALRPQLLDSSDSIPMDDYDWRVDGVIFPGGLADGTKDSPH